MIKISNLNKYYNKGRRNELHVIDDISLELPDTGFVVILGKSGSGKTTLLNVIGGLDKASGKIDYGDFISAKYQSRAIDPFRNDNVGYVFQNYLLLNDEFVWRNLDIALSVYGISDKAERLKRTNLALEAVGMSRYRRKLASALSGGQKQRVAIARALAKLPRIIIADEPTGNLDSENGEEVMKILREVSHDRLVLMVTHSEVLAKRYSDRIIEYTDGQIVGDILNTPSFGGDNKPLPAPANERVISLFALSKETASTQNATIESYSDGSTSPKIEIKLFTKEGKNYLYVDSKAVSINPASVTLKETKKPIEEEIASKDEEPLSSFDHSTFENAPRRRIGFLSMLKSSLAAFFLSPKKKKTKAFRIASFIVGLALSAITLTAFSSYFSQSYLKLSDHVDFSALAVKAVTPNYEMGIEGHNLTVSEYLSAVDKPSESGITGMSVMATLKTKDFAYCGYSTAGNSTVAVRIGCSPLNRLSPTIREGEAPTNENECAISYSVIDRLFPNLSSTSLSYSSFIGQKLYDGKIGNPVIYEHEDVSPTIVGLTADNVPSLYLTANSGVRFAYKKINTSGISYREYSGNPFDYIDFLKKDEAAGLTLTKTRESELSNSDNLILNVYSSDKASSYINLFTANNTLAYNKLVDINFVGTVDSSSSVIVLEDDTNDDSLAFDVFRASLAAAFPLETSVPSDLVITGRAPEKLGEYLIPSIGSEKTTTLIKNFLYYIEDSPGSNSPTQEATIVGTYAPGKNSYGPIYGTIETYISQIFYYGHPVVLDTQNSEAVNPFSYYYTKALYSSDAAKTITYLSGLGYEASSFSDAYSALNMKNQTDSGMMVFAIVLAVIVAILLLVTILTTRSNMIRHIYSISVYRSIGAGKDFIYKIFMADSLVQTTFTIFSGSLLFFIVYWVIAGVYNITVLPFYIPLAILAGTYLFSLLGTFIPLFFLLQKTPHEISVKYDI